MKDQQHSAQNARDRRDQEAREQHPAAAQLRGALLPAQQWARLLRRGGDLPELPVPLLERLAEAVGNSCLTDLLRQGGGGGSIPWAPELPPWEGQAPEVNPIHTAPPLLLPLGPWPEGGGPWLPPARLGGG